MYLNYDIYYSRDGADSFPYSINKKMLHIYTLAYSHLSLDNVYCKSLVTGFKNPWKFFSCNTPVFLILFDAVVNNVVHFIAMIVVLKVMVLMKMVMAIVIVAIK